MYQLKTEQVKSHLNWEKPRDLRTSSLDETGALRIQT
jgi:hypothetical protein